MAEIVERLGAPMLEFLEWVRFRPRTHAEAMEAWGSHCPRFTQWEDALDLGLIELVAPGTGVACQVQLTPQGCAALEGR